jgi:hypothetical protein
MVAVLLGVSVSASAITMAASTNDASRPPLPPLAQQWLGRWETNILHESETRYCDTEMGEELGWLASPLLNGFYYGYLATHDPKWADRLIDWTDAIIRRAVTEPDGYVGWPKPNVDSANRPSDTVTDNMLGEAMALRPVVLMAGEIRKTPALNAKYGAKADAYIALAEKTYEKWDARGCWRRTDSGGLWVFPMFGIDSKSGAWTDGYARRTTEGFSAPANKENLIANWLIALYDVTDKPIYQQRAEQWWRLMKSRMTLRGHGRYYVWNYWDPAGPWDYKPDGSPRHWIGVHANGGYYAADVESMVIAYEHHLVFTRDDIARLIATNRDFMWDGRFTNARFRRIDGGLPDMRWLTTPGVLWIALVPYDPTLRKVFEATHNPVSWSGLFITPWYIAQLQHPASSSPQEMQNAPAP